MVKLLTLMATWPWYLHLCMMYMDATYVLKTPSLYLAHMHAKLQQKHFRLLLNKSMALFRTWTAYSLHLCFPAQGTPCRECNRPHSC